MSIDKNKVTGGTAGQRWKLALLLAAARCARGQRANFYSQPGAYTAEKLFEGEPFGYRSDCSQLITAAAWTCGLPNPNGDIPWTAGGYTGTQNISHNGWKIVSEEAMKEKGWGRIVYGSGSGHHTEAYVGGPGHENRTIGHGSAPIDEGVIDLFGDSNYTCLILDD